MCVCLCVLLCVRETVFVCGYIQYECTAFLAHLINIQRHNLTAGGSLHGL